VHQVLGTRCHLWAGGKGVSGHGQFKHEGKVQGAHRMAFLMAHGRWPVPHALHHCDNLLCVNPEHLFEGHVRKDVSEQHHLTPTIAPREELLTSKQIDSIRNQFNGRNLKQLAKRFGITNSYATELVYTTTRLARQETSVGVRA
jgi:HNH endonuclease